jgi:hypothetical protein
MICRWCFCTRRENNDGNAAFDRVMAQLTFSGRYFILSDLCIIETGGFLK